MTYWIRRIMDSYGSHIFIVCVKNTYVKSRVTHAIKEKSSAKFLPTINEGGVQYKFKSDNESMLEKSGV